MKKIKDIRKKLGIKQSIISNYLGISQGRYSIIESDKCTPKNIEQIKKDASTCLKLQAIRLKVEKLAEVYSIENSIKELEKYGTNKP